MIPHHHARLATLAGLLFALNGCGGGGGTAPGTGGLALDGMFFGRGIETAAGLDTVSPLSTVKTDALTGLIIPGTLAPLGPGVELDELVTMGLGPEFIPLVVPRNAVLVLRFTRTIDPASVVADKLDDDGRVLQAGSLRVRTQDDLAVPVQLRVQGSEIRVNPSSIDRVGFPPSPLVFDDSGRAVADPTGYLRLILPRSGSMVLRSEDQARLQPRADRLGDPSHPIGFNPGNAELDFIERNNLFPSLRGFNGFLPDLAPPRLVREFSLDGALSLEEGDRVSSSSLFIHDAAFDTTANSGAGEWAGHLLLIRPGTRREERHVLLSNNAQLLVLADHFADPPSSGELWRLLRSEYFEPDPNDPIDPELFDPDNRENANNVLFRNFITFEEIDASGHYADADGDGRIIYTGDEVIPSRAVLKVRFNEPMDLATVLPYESFRVVELPEPEANGMEHVGAIRAEEGGRVMAYWPVREDQSPAGTDEYIGFGQEQVGNRLVVLRTVPDLGFLEDRIPPDEVAAFVRDGFKGVTDLGGLPLAFALSEFSPAEIMIEYTASFTFKTVPGQLYSDVGAVVHRFQGVPQTGIDPETQQPGVRFHDQEGFYGPILADINVRVNGVLAPAPVAFFRRTLDNVPGNNPPGDRFDAWPLGAGAPISGSLFGGVLYASIYGARFQHVYPMALCSLAPTGDLSGSFFDLYRVSFAPIGGNVTHDIYEDISIHAAHTQVAPTTNQFSGLGAPFDTATYNGSTKPCGKPKQKFPNYIDPMQRVVPAGTPWVIDQNNLFTPSETLYAYHPWPTFKSRFRYDNVHSMTLEYRIRPQETPISFQNGFTFSAARINSPLPRYRVYSLGSANNILLPDPNRGDPRAKCASGPQPKPQRFGDNSRYFYAFDYVKTYSSVRSPFVKVTKSEDPRFLPAIISPAPNEMPPDTSISLEFRGAENPVIYRDKPEEGWTDDPGNLDGFDWIQFRIHIEGNPESLLVPTLDSIILPYYR